MQNRGPNGARKRRAPRAAFTLVELLVVIAIIGILIALLLPAVQAAREAGRRTQCGSNIHQVALALLTYEDTHKIFPPGMVYDAGERPDATLKYRPNWITLILPQMDQRPLYESFNFAAYISDPLNQNGCDQVTPGNWVPRPKPGDGGRSAVIPSILCPSDNRNNRVLFAGVISGEPGNWARGNVACNAGGAYIGNTYAELWDAKSLGWKDPKWRGVMGPNDAEISLAGMSDGTTCTILVAELRAGVSPLDRRGTWAMGGAGASMVAMYGAGGDDNGPNACFQEADDIWGGDQFQYDDAEMNRECMSMCYTCLNYQQTTRSLHPGGTNIAMGDASVHFISNYIETENAPWDQRTLWAVWDRLILSSDGLPVDNKRAGL